jgi:hypothetical protein
LDAADLVVAGLVVEQQDDQARDGGEALEVRRAGEFAAGAGGQPAALAGAQHDSRLLGVGPVADAGDERPPSWPLRASIAASVWIDSVEMSHRLLAASSMWRDQVTALRGGELSATRSSVPAARCAAVSVTSKSAGLGSRASWVKKAPS